MDKDGGLEHVLFSHILGILIPTDFHSMIFQRGRAKSYQPEKAPGAPSKSLEIAGMFAPCPSVHPLKLSPPSPGNDLQFNVALKSYNSLKKVHLSDIEPT